MDQRTYRNFDLAIERTEQGYRARIQDPPEGQTPWVSFALPFTVAERSAAVAAIWSTDGSRAYRLGGEQPTDLDPHQFGQRLFDALFQGPLLIGLNRTLAQVEQAGEGLRLRLHLGDAPDLAALPWEYLHGPPPYGFFALSQQTPLVRYLALQQTQRPLTVEPPLHILAVIADPVDLEPRLKVEHEWQHLHQELGKLQADGIVTLERLPAATVDALQSRLSRPPAVHILHFIGHGYYDAGRRTGGLVLEDGEQRRHLVDAAALGALLYDHTSLRLVFLNVCEGGRSDEADPFTGLAQHLVQRRLPAVIAMQYTVTDNAAIRLAATFYRALADGQPVDAALAQARQALFAQRQRLEWGTPVLFLRVPDGRLFDLPDREDQPAPGAEPYQGLDYYDVDDAPRFFGREALTAELVAYLRDHRFLAVIGASGSGKSSLVRAGLVPALKRGEPLLDGVLPPKGSERWPVHIITPKAHPLKELAATLTRDSGSDLERARLIDELAQDPRVLDLRVTRLLSGTSADRLLLVVDQFEELFTLCRDPLERQHFANNLLTAAQEDGATTVVITLRADFYHRCADFDNLRQALGDLGGGRQKYIGPMSEDELRRAIEEPARLGGWDLEPGLVDLLLADVAAEPGALPLLSHALLETWKRRRGRTLTLAGYAASGRVQGAIAKTAEAVLNGELTAEQRLIARNIFVRLTELGEGVQDTRRRVALGELVPKHEGAEAVESVLKALADARLITTDQDEVEVAHEALIREWDTLREWLQDDREGLRTHRRLTEAAAEWATHQDPSFLYRGTRLTQIEEWVESHAGDLNDQETAFLTASLAERQRELDEQERIEREREAARVEREKARERELQQARIARNRSWMAVGAMAAAFVLAVIIGVLFYQQYLAYRNRLQALETLSEARALKEELKAEEAIAKFQEAADLATAAGIDLGIDLADEITATIRYRADRAQLQALDTLSEARALKEELRAEEAIAKFQEAGLLAAAAIDLGIDLSAEMTDTRRYVATALVQQGEAMLREANESGSAALYRTAYISATALFSAALALDPPSDTPVYVKIPAGEFLMGSDDSDMWATDEEKPQHLVYLDEYWIQRTEVTKAQYRRCMEQGPCQEPTDYQIPNAQFDRIPVTGVTWEQAQTYAAWVGSRLPTEAEWEKACRWDTDQPAARIYPWSDDPPNPELLNYHESNFRTPVDVGRYKSGANGLYDMAGNVWEWTADWFDRDYYNYSPRQNPTGPDDGYQRTRRGGSFTRLDQDIRCARRYEELDQLYRIDFDGFRVVVPSPGF